MSAALDITHVAPLSALTRSHEPQFGGKSANLGAMIAAAIPVPSGFAIGTGAFDAFLATDGLAEAIRSALAGLPRDDLTALMTASETIKALMLATPIPQTISTAIEEAYAQLARADGQERPPVAVRSSARGEDSSQATFAGQQDSYLWVRGVEAVQGALRDCWASLYTPAAISYRQRLEDPGHPPAMGVTVQLMVDAAVSGVLFTSSPLTGDPSVVAINASWGIGLGVVGGEVTPDEYVLSKVTGELLRRTINRKHLGYGPDEQAGGVVAVAIRPELQEVACLEAPMLEALSILGRRIESHFGCPQDIEWAIAPTADGADGIFVLQARPITTRHEPAPELAGKTAISHVMRTFGARSDRRAGP